MIEMNYVALIIIEYIFSTSHNIPITFMKLEYTTFTYFIQYYLCSLVQFNHFLNQKRESNQQLVNLG